MPHVLKTKHRPSISKRAKIITAVCTLLAVVLAFGGLYVKQLEVRAAAAAEAASFVPAKIKPAERDPIVAFLGDSFTTGGGASAQQNRWTTQVSQANGWFEVNFGFGGTNYATSGSVDGAMPYTEQVQDIVKLNPQIVFVSSAGNGLNEDQSGGIRNTFQELREGLPDARIIATSPYTRVGPYPGVLANFGEIIKAEVEAVRGEYMDLGHPLGERDDVMAEDEVHPNNAGHRLIADAVQALLSED